MALHVSFQSQRVKIRLNCIILRTYKIELIKCKRILDSVAEWHYLGHWLCYNLEDSSHILMKLSNFIVYWSWFYYPLAYCDIFFGLVKGLKLNHNFMPGLQSNLQWFDYTYIIPGTCLFQGVSLTLVTHAVWWFCFVWYVL